MRFLLDTNILIPLQDSLVVLQPSLANFVRLAQENGHQLLYHPASEKDIDRDLDQSRRQRTRQRLSQYSRLDQTAPCPWNSPTTSPNDSADNEILFALACDAAHALVTEDQGIHNKAKQRGLSDRCYFIQTAEDWLKRLHEQESIHLPNIEDSPLHTLTPTLGNSFYDSLRNGYDGFDTWFRKKAQEGRKAWIYRDEDGEIGALCIYAIQHNQRVTDEGKILNGPALKLSTFKVSETCRGRKIGELFLKAAFRLATANDIENIFVHANAADHLHLIGLLEDFGFEAIGCYTQGRMADTVYLKEHPISPPKSELPPFQYHKKFYPHFRTDEQVSTFIVPIQPQFHQILFPDYGSDFDRQQALFRSNTNVGNAIKLAYLCHANVRSVKAGDIVFFYRSDDERAITSLGIVEDFQILQDAAAIASVVRRRTVYSMRDIESLSQKPTKVMLFRLARHFSPSISSDWLKKNAVVKGNIQTIRKIDERGFREIMASAHG